MSAFFGARISTATAADVDCSADLPDEHPYKKLLADARAADDADLERYLCVIQGISKDGVPILLFAPRLGFANDINLPQAQKDRELKRMLLHFIKKANSVVTGRYIMIYAHTPLTILSQQPIIYKYYKMLPREYKKNLLHLYIVHGNFLMRSFFEIGVRWFVSDKFYKKLHFIPSIAELQRIVGVCGLALPPLFVQNEDDENDFMTEKAIDIAKKAQVKACAKAGAGSAAAAVKINTAASIKDTFVPALGTTRLIDRCCTYIRNSPEGLKKLGLFRLSGDNNMLSAARRRLASGNVDHMQCIYIGTDDPAFQEGSAASARDMSPSTPSSSFVPSSILVTDVDTVTNILKVSLRMLGDPIIPLSQYAALIEATKQYTSTKDDDIWVNTIKSIHATLPIEHAATIDHLMSFLSEVTQYSEVNKMDAENLARIFSPTFFQQHLKEDADPMVVFAEVNMGAKILKKLIEMHAAAAVDQVADLNQKMINRLTVSGGFRGGERGRTKSQIEHIIDADCEESSEEESEEEEVVEKTARPGRMAISGDNGHGNFDADGGKRI